MTIQEAFEKAQSICEIKRPTIFDGNTDVSQVNCSEVLALSIFHDYNKELPEISLFPNITSFHSTKILSMEYINTQDFSQIKSLYLSFDKNCGEIKVHAPQLEELTIYICNNDSDQINIFDEISTNVIDISNLPNLRTIKLMHTTGYKIITKVQQPTITQLIITDRRDNDFEFVTHFPCIEQLTICDSQCTDISFLRELKCITHLNLSHNEIMDISPITITDIIKSIDLYRNPVKNIHVLDAFSGELVFSEKDYAIKRFASTMWTLSNMAYHHVQACKKDDSKRSPYLKKLYSEKSELELYLDCFTMLLKREKEKLYQDKRSILTDKDIDGFVEKEYPFLLN